MCHMPGWLLSQCRLSRSCVVLVDVPVRPQRVAQCSEGILISRALSPRNLQGIPASSAMVFTREEQLAMLLRWSATLGEV
jgi:hypothetical protein